MRITRIHTPQTLVPGSTLALEEGPSHHLARVLRATVGDAVSLFDGRGAECLATISAVEKRQVHVRVGEPVAGAPESPLWVELGVAVSRGEKMDWVMQKVTELGVSAIVPLITARCEVRLSGERWEKKTDHWRAVTIGACEQSGRRRLPEVSAPRLLSGWLGTLAADRRLMLHPGGCSSAPGPAPRHLALLTGPEGGFSEEDVVQAQAAGFECCTLGPRILRAETAPVAALAAAQLWWGDWRA